MHNDRRRYAPATERNREPIAAVLAEELPASGIVLEVASGSGEHCAFFAARFPALTWQPSDPDADSRASIADWCADLPNVAAPLDIDAAAGGWPEGRVDAMLCINMVHISPWEATLGLMAAAGRLLGSWCPLILYGPYRREGVETAPSNEKFEEWLHSLSPEYGLRHIEDMRVAGAENGMTLRRVIEMPANNLILLFRRGR